MMLLPADRAGLVVVDIYVRPILSGIDFQEKYERI